jgi:alpha-galactosidase
VVVVPLAGGRSGPVKARPGWAAAGIVLTGQVLMRTGLQLPVMHPDQALILHLTQA